MAFEDRTFDNILAEMLAMAPDGVDTRQGSIYYDAVAACALKLANFYVDASCILDLVFVWSATGEYLDRRGAECGLERNAATNARYFYVYEGTRPSAGTRFFTDGLFFTLEEARDGTLYLVVESPGESSNIVLARTPATPVNAIPGLTVSEFGRLDEPGADKESDESYRTRIQEKIAGPAQNGNKQHYKTWCESVEGIGRARITPLWNGPNTVKATLITPLGRAPSAAVVAEVQEYVDPAEKGYTAVVNGKTYIVGDGLGEGAANMGAHFTATAAETVDISLTVNVELAKTAARSSVEDEIKSAVENYFKTLALEAEENTVVRITAIGAIISSIDSVLDYNGLTLNGIADNIIIDESSVPELSEVSVNAI